MWLPHAQLQICSESSSVDAFIEALQQTSDWYSEDFADPATQTRPFTTDDRRF